MTRLLARRESTTSWKRRPPCAALATGRRRLLVTFALRRECGRRAIVARPRYLARSDSTRAGSDFRCGYRTRTRTLSRPDLGPPWILRTLTLRIFGVPAMNRCEYGIRGAPGGSGSLRPVE